MFVSRYQSPLGEMLLASDDIGLAGIWFEGAKYYGRGMDRDIEDRECPAILSAKQWLDIYFCRKTPNFLPPLHMKGTPFQLAVWELLLEIPFGGTMSYGELAQKTAARLGLARVSARAVGGALGRNKFTIIAPCHRVLGSRGDLTGYAGGIRKKILLLLHEGHDIGEFRSPRILL